MIIVRIFSALGVPLLRGRHFTEADRRDSPRVAIINETLARQFFPGEDPVGKRFKRGGADRPDIPYMEIVGVVGDVKYQGLDAEVRPAYYEPHLQNPSNAMYLVVSAAVADRWPRAAVRKEVWGVDGGMPVSTSTRWTAFLQGGRGARFRTSLIAVFAAWPCAGAVGIYA